MRERELRRSKSKRLGRRAIGLAALAAASALACGGGVGGSLEVLTAVPAHVLTVEDLASRIRRAPYELGTRLGAVRVVGVLVGSPVACPPGLLTCAAGDQARYRIADYPGGSEVAVEIVSAEAAEVTIGRRYVFYGSAESRPDSSRRWVLVAQVHAEVRQVAPDAER